MEKSLKEKPLCSVHKKRDPCLLEKIVEHREQQQMCIVLNVGLSVVDFVKWDEDNLVGFGLLDLLRCRFVQFFA